MQPRLFLRDYVTREAFVKALSARLGHIPEEYRRTLLRSDAGEELTEDYTEVDVPQTKLVAFPEMVRTAPCCLGFP